ncbi:PIN/TRAM domain-containing protein [Candidatus Contubernalis alkaliaceticus]|uniref:PIN/TRAM domain-containing protein n=1 Tax=Candidatus Contubernalis alkaliaceticus TaxID=338645 RepID=UPI001F4BD8D1|nr:PIN domain-containing protein [Candidatus Contubernalis alkalaceticus]UNC93352.1 PIN domain nuclease [Candidatus Contubernalis alkalaceticus]
MIPKIFRIISLIIGFVLGYQAFNAGFNALSTVTTFNLTETGLSAASISVSVLGGSAFGIIFYIITPIVINQVVQFTSWVDGKLKLIPTQDIVLGTIGLVIGLSIAALLSLALYRIPWVGVYLSLAVTLVLGYVGIHIVTNRKEELSFITSLFAWQAKGEKVLSDKGIKVLDTSVIIDGRIADLCKTGFMEGVLMIPGFVLDELRHIADSSDVLKRNRGRRGLDILNKIQKELDIPVKITEQDFEDMEVDSKLVKLAKLLKGKVVTNDYNLNKVCELQGVSVLNINELANALKPVVLPGEEMTVQIIKDGKEMGQGIGYLDDGTMIVVDGGKKHMMQHLEVVVTSVLQTAAGRMIFARPKAYLAKYINEAK